MRLSCVLTILSIAFLFAAATPSKPAGGTRPAPRMTVDLDTDPSKRWNDVVSAFKPDIMFVINTVIKGVPLSPAEVKLFTALLGDLDTFMGAPYADELRGVAAALDAPLGDVVLMNLFYELTAACTSIVATNSSGYVFHGRNLDYNVPGLRNITVQLTFTQGGKPVYHGVTYAGYVGLLTGVRPGAFSVSVDERHTNNGSIIDNALEAFLEGGASIGTFLRSVLGSSNVTYTAALHAVSTQHLIAPVYIIMGGVHNEGAIVTRDRQQAADVWQLAPPSRWFEVQTNYDHWKPVPSSDDRRDPANRRMNATTSSSVTLDYLRDSVLNLYPNLNGMTTYTTIMSASSDTGSMSTIVQNTNAP